jgi:REP element-mobilizing transposase RayT
MGRSRYKIIEEDKPHFLTCTTVNWLPLFTNPEIGSIIFESLKFMQDNDRLTIYAYILMENHLHLIASLKELSKEIGIFKSYTARKIIDHLKERNAKDILKLLNFYKLKHKRDRDYQLWQEGSNPKQILNEKMMIQKIEYMHFNPVKRGYIDEPVHWRYSSARNYEGLECMLEITQF